MARTAGGVERMRVLTIAITAPQQGKVAGAALQPLSIRRHLLFVPVIPVLVVWAHSPFKREDHALCRGRECNALAAPRGLVTPSLRMVNVRTLPVVLPLALRTRVRSCTVWPAVKGPMALPLGSTATLCAKPVLTPLSSHSTLLVVLPS
jgi:hypothetical protein